MKMIHRDIDRPSETPVTLETVRDYLRIVDQDEDATITGLMHAATSHIESTCGVKLIRRRVEILMDRLPDEPWVELPVSPVDSIVSFQYRDQDGDWHDFESAKYRLIADEYRPSIAFSLLQPFHDELGSNIKIVVNAGYDHTPMEIRQAILLIVSHWFESRTPVTFGAIASNVPMSAVRLLQSFKRYQA